MRFWQLNFYSEILLGNHKQVQGKAVHASIGYEDERLTEFAKAIGLYGTILLLSASKYFIKFC